MHEVAHGRAKVSWPVWAAGEAPSTQGEGLGGIVDRRQLRCRSTTGVTRLVTYQAGLAARPPLLRSMHGKATGA